MNDVSDDKKFYKNMSGPLLLVRNGVGDGLFTVSLAVRIVSWLRFPDPLPQAYVEEPNWGIAHELCSVISLFFGR